MSIQITDLAVGTPVLDATGLELGVVSAIEDGAAMLDPNPTIADELCSVFGLARTGPDHVPITTELVDSTDSGVIRLSLPNRLL